MVLMLTTAPKGQVSRPLLLAEQSAGRVRCPLTTMTTTILKDLIGHLCDWHEELEQGPSGPEWEAECRACSTALNALVGIKVQRQLAYSADEALCDKLAEKAETAANWTDKDSEALEAAFGLSDARAEEAEQAWLDTMP